MFGAAVMGLPAQLPTGLKLTRLMDDLQAGFQTLPVKLPASPYSRALDARRVIVDMINEQIESMPTQVRSIMSYHVLNTGLMLKGSWCTVLAAETQA